MSTDTLMEAVPLVVEHLSLSFGGNQVLHDIAVNLQPGAITGLIGPNGAGKTSFFNCLTGLYSPQKGSIRFGATELKGVAPPGACGAGLLAQLSACGLVP